MTSCNGCAGAPAAGCCYPVMSTRTKMDVVKIAHLMDPADVRFILDDLTLLPYREGIRRASHLQGREPMMLDQDGNESRPVFYECRHYDVDSKRCGNYEGRPPMCRDFPWYGGTPRADAALPAACSYWADIPVALRRRGYPTETGVQRA